jgi:hypothetical protein
MAKVADDQTQYDGVCHEKFDEIICKLDTINNKLFIGNGNPSLVIRVDRLEQAKKLAGKALWLAAGAWVVLIVGSLWKVITGVGK